jgi:hypothetical protein
VCCVRINKKITRGEAQLHCSIHETLASIPNVKKKMDAVMDAYNPN